jgi:hypothetical protein
MLSDSIVALIRTIVPSIIGSLIALGVNAGIEFGEGTAENLSVALIPICISAYYALATYLERNVNANLGWLLGQPKAPTYSGEDSNEEKLESGEYAGE